MQPSSGQVSKDPLELYSPVFVVLALFAAAVAGEVLVLHHPELVAVVEAER